MWAPDRPANPRRSQPGRRPEGMAPATLNIAANGTRSWIRCRKIPTPSGACSMIPATNFRSGRRTLLPRAGGTRSQETFCSVYERARSRLIWRFPVPGKAPRFGSSPIQTDAPMQLVKRCGSSCPRLQDSWVLHAVLLTRVFGIAEPRFVQANGSYPVLTQSSRNS